MRQVLLFFPGQRSSPRWRSSCRALTLWPKGVAARPPRAVFPQLHRQAAAHIAHAVDDLIHRYPALNARKGHVRRADGIHRADDVPLHAGDLHQPRHRVAGQAQQVFQGHGHSMADLLRRSAPQIHQGPSRHGGCRAHLRLAAAGGAGDGGPVADDGPDAGGHVQRPDDGILLYTAPAVQGHQHRRQYAAGPRRGGRHDPVHAGVGLRHAQCRGDDLLEVGAAEGLLSGGVVPHLLGIPPHQAADAAPVCPVGVHRLHHGPPGGVHLPEGGLRRHLPLFHVRVPHHLPEGFLTCLDLVENLLHGIQRHLSLPPSRNR